MAIASASCIVSGRPLVEVGIAAVPIGEVAGGAGACWAVALRRAVLPRAPGQSASFVSRRHLRNRCWFSSVNHQVDRRHQEHRQHNGGAQTLRSWRVPAAHTVRCPPRIPVPSAAKPAVSPGRSSRSAATSPCTLPPLLASIPSHARADIPENSTIKMLFDTTIPVIMITPISDMMFSVVWVIHKEHVRARKPGRDRRQNDEWIDERPELRHQNQVHQNDR